MFFSTIEFITAAFPLAASSCCKYVHTSQLFALQSLKCSSAPTKISFYIYIPWMCCVSDSESNCDPSLPAGVGFPWSWPGALASAGPSLSVSITDTLPALWIQSCGGHTAAQSEIRETLSICVFKRLIQIWRDLCSQIWWHTSVLVKRNVTSCDRWTLYKLGWMTLNQ